MIEQQPVRFLQVALIEAEAFKMPAVGGAVPPLFAALEPPPWAAGDSDELQVIAVEPASAARPCEAPAVLE